MLPSHVIFLLVTASQSIARRLTLESLTFDPMLDVSSANQSTDYQRKYETAYTLESSFWVSNPISADEFYHTPLDKATSPPGSILRFEEINQAKLTSYDLPPGITLYRMLYQSLDMNNNVVPASAIILMPYSRTSRHPPFRVITWAHGTAGLNPQCAPSNQKDLLYGYTAPFTMVYRGYAVIAVDYAGLGSNTTFHYLAGPSHAADISYAVEAAREALPRGTITHEWVVVGHSEGGLAAWATNEREVSDPTGGFLGAVAIAPALQDLQIVRYGIEHGGLADSMFYASYTLTAIMRLNELIDPTQYYSRVGLERMRLAEEGCVLSIVAALGNLTFSDIFDDESWIYSDWAEDWEQRTGVDGHMPLARPMLVIQATEDTATYPVTQATVLKTHCDMYPDARIHIMPYPRTEHLSVLGVSQVEYFDWIDNRFRREDVEEGCTGHLIGAEGAHISGHLRQKLLVQS